MFSIESILIVVSAILTISVIASKASSKMGVPSLLLFLFLGIVIGKEGFHLIKFSDPAVIQAFGVLALVFILFFSGADTEWKKVKPVFREGVLLSTVGVLLTALAVGWFATVVLGFSLLEGLLLGAIVSSTDATAVFSVLRSKKVSLSGDLQPLLELESGSNDPMAVFLTIGFTSLLLNPEKSFMTMFPTFFLQMGLGALFGYIFGVCMFYLVNKLKLEYDGLYPVLTTALVLLAYAVSVKSGGNGFLTAYIAGIVMGNRNFAHKKSLVNFHGGVAWLMQISMFLALGLLIMPSMLMPAAIMGILVSLFLMVFARPLSVFIALIPSKLGLSEKALVSWVGLRASVPIILATFPLLAGVDKSGIIFNIVFFVVLTSMLLQGTTVHVLAKTLGVAAPFKDTRKYPIEFEHTDKMNMRLVDFLVPYGSAVIGKAVVELGLPQECLITLIARGEDFIVPGGNTVIEDGDILLILVDNKDLAKINQILATQKE
ncbi:MAG: potassium/proton antiporter [Elusimicrobiota bacterium]